MTPEVNNGRLLKKCQAETVTTAGIKSLTTPPLKDKEEVIEAMCLVKVTEGSVEAHTTALKTRLGIQIYAWEGWRLWTQSVASAL